MIKNLLFRPCIKTFTTMLTLLTLFFIFQNANSQCSLTGWQKISQGENFTIALKADGTMWMWGRNLDGIVGNGSGSATIVEHPVQIGTDTNWSDISVGRYFALALKSNGNLYGWGDNEYGNFGLGNHTDLYTPTLINTNVVSFSAGYYHTTVVKSNGTLWGSGYNDWSCLGIGNSIGFVNVFTQEASLATNWTKTYAGYYNSFGIKENGTLWSCGANVQGQTGLNTLSGETSTFTQVGTDTNWASVSCGVYHVLGLKTNGKMWGWGSSFNGRLGIAGTSNEYLSTPQPIAAENNWSAIATGWDHSGAIRSDGTLFCFGSNGGGKSGIPASSGDTYNLAPVQVGTDSDWTSISNRLGIVHSGGLKDDTSIWSWGADDFYQLGNDDGLASNNHIPTKSTCTDALSVNNFTKDAIAFYPNPADNVINIATKLTISSIKIYSVDGKLIKEINTNASGIYVGDMAKGLYLLKINDTEAQRFLKK